MSGETENVANESSLVDMVVGLKERVESNPLLPIENRKFLLAVADRMLEHPSNL